jgi:nicotinamide phosphoribosyltransferase
MIEPLKTQPILDSDGYKFSHWPQYPPGAQFIDAHLTARGSAKWKYAVPAGFQYYTHEVLATPLTRFDIEEARDDFGSYFGSTDLFNQHGFDHILNKHGGFWPVKMRALPEGWAIPVGLPLMNLRNTDPVTPWVTNFLETPLHEVWYPCTVATLSSVCYGIILEHLVRSGTPEAIDYKLHDFGFRGVSSRESAAIGGAAHLYNFKGSDTFRAIRLLKRYYGVKNAGDAGVSVPAAEHSTITSWGREHEVDAIRNLLYRYPTGIVAAPMDSYDVYAACEHILGDALKAEILARNGVFVARLDSGHPPEVAMKVLRILDKKFGSTINDKGYRVLDPHVRILPSDKNDPQMIDLILSVMEVNGYSADNIATFGMGGALLQLVNRDDLEFAFKASYIVGDGYERSVFKSPVGQSSKKSLGGRELSRSTRTITSTCAAPESGSSDARDEHVHRLLRHGQSVDQPDVGRHS